MIKNRTISNSKAQLIFHEACSLRAFEFIDLILQHHSIWRTPSIYLNPDTFKYIIFHKNCPWDASVILSDCRFYYFSILIELLKIFYERFPTFPTCKLHISTLVDVMNLGVEFGDYNNDKGITQIYDYRQTKQAQIKKEFNRSNIPMMDIPNTAQIINSYVAFDEPERDKEILGRLYTILGIGVPLILFFIL
jgi:hypothetical protein